MHQDEEVWWYAMATQATIQHLNTCKSRVLQSCYHFGSHKSQHVALEPLVPTSASYQVKYRDDHMSSICYCVFTCVLPLCAGLQQNGLRLWLTGCKFTPPHPTRQQAFCTGIGYKRQCTRQWVDDSLNCSRPSPVFTKI